MKKSIFCIVNDDYYKCVADITLIEARELETRACSSMNEFEEEKLEEKTEKEFDSFVAGNASQTG